MTHRREERRDGGEDAHGEIVRTGSLNKLRGEKGGKKTRIKKEGIWTFLELFMPSPACISQRGSVRGDRGKIGRKKKKKAQANPAFTTSLLARPEKKKVHAR